MKKYSKGKIQIDGLNRHVGEANQQNNDERVLSEECNLITSENQRKTSKEKSKEGELRTMSDDETTHYNDRVENRTRFRKSPVHYSDEEMNENRDTDKIMNNDPMDHFEVEEFCESNLSSKPSSDLIPPAKKHHIDKSAIESLHEFNDMNQNARWNNVANTDHPELKQSIRQQSQQCNILDDEFLKSLMTEADHEIERAKREDKAIGLSVRMKKKKIF